MHDTLIINVPLQLPFVRHLGGDDYGIVGEIHHYGMRTYGGVRFDAVTGKTEFYDISSPFEKLPSSFADMAIKFYHKTKNCTPYVSLNASPKFLQGHNVYGTDYIQELAIEMLGTLKSCYPVFWQFLDVSRANIARMDITYFTRLDNPDLLQPVIEMMGNISIGQRKADHARNKFATTRYWCKASNRVGYCKLYAKADELQSNIKSLVRRADKGNAQAKNLLDIFNDDLQAFSTNLLRFEATCKKEMLVKKNLPTNLWDFIRHQRFYPNATLTLWEHWFNPILNAMQGEIMTNYDDYDVLALCKARLVTTTAKGKTSYTKANNAYRFYCFLKDKGYEHAKSVTPKNTFNDNVRNLVFVGLPKSHLQNLNGNQSKTISLVELIKFDFSSQVPPNYQPVKSRFHGEFDEFLQPQLRLVA